MRSVRRIPALLTLLLCTTLARASAPARVDIDNFAFSPAALTVAAGTEVVWTNHDDDPHTIVSTAATPLFKSQAIDTDERFAFVFKEPGVYAYFCSIHPKMQGQVIVQ